MLIPIQLRKFSGVFCFFFLNSLKAHGIKTGTTLMYFMNYLPPPNCKVTIILDLYKSIFSNYVFPYKYNIFLSNVLQWEDIQGAGKKFIFICYLLMSQLFVTGQLVFSLSFFLSVCLFFGLSFSLMRVLSPSVEHLIANETITEGPSVESLSHISH